MQRFTAMSSGTILSTTNSIVSLALLRVSLRIRTPPSDSDADRDAACRAARPLRTPVAGRVRGPMLALAAAVEIRVRAAVRERSPRITATTLEPGHAKRLRGRGISHGASIRPFAAARGPIARMAPFAARRFAGDRASPDRDDPGRRPHPRVGPAHHQRAHRRSRALYNWRKTASHIAFRIALAICRSVTWKFSARRLRLRVRSTGYLRAP